MEGKHKMAVDGRMRKEETGKWLVLATGRKGGRGCQYGGREGGREAQDYRG